MTEEEADYLARHGAVTGPVYPDDEAPSADENFREALAEQRQRDCAKILESAADLIFSSRTDRVAHMRVSVAIAILRQDLNVGAIAEHFEVSWARIEQIIREMRERETFGSPPDK